MDGRNYTKKGKANLHSDDDADIADGYQQDYDSSDGETEHDVHVPSLANKKNPNDLEDLLEASEDFFDDTDELIYHAPKPTYSWTSWAKFIALRFFFPPVLLWDGLKLLVNHFAGEKLGATIVPASVKGDQLAEDDNTAKANKELLALPSKHIHCKQVIINTHDQASLDTVELEYIGAQKKHPKARQYIINFAGNGQRYEDNLEEMAADAKAFAKDMGPCTVIGFNYRGVGKSIGKPRAANDLVVDGIAQVQHLLAQGVNPENITLKGHSLGGGVAALVAKHFHSHDKKVNLFDGRSFSTMTNVAVGWIRIAQKNPEKVTGYKETIGGIILGWLAKPFIKLALALTKWEIDAEAAYREIPDTHKEYMVVHSSKQARGLNQNGKPLKHLPLEFAKPKDDTVIPHYASLHMALKDERREHKKTLDKAKALHNKAMAKTDLLVDADMHRAQNALDDARNRIKERKVQAPTELKQENAHLLRMDDLYDRGHDYATTLSKKDSHNSSHGVYTGATFFRRFVARAHEHHEKVKAYKPFGG